MRQIGIKYSTFMRRRDSNMEHEKTNEYSLNLIDLFCVDQWKAWKILFTSLDNIVSWMTSRGTSVTRVISSVYNGSTMDLQWIYNGTRQTISSATLHFTPVTLSQYHFDVHTSAHQDGRFQACDWSDVTRSDPSLVEAHNSLTLKTPICSRTPWTYSA